MSVRVESLGRLGNNLFQYCLGRIIAEHHGLAFEWAPMRAALLTSEELQWSSIETQTPSDGTLAAQGAQIFSTDLAVAGERVSQPVEAYEIQRGGSWSGQRLDLAALLANSARRQIRLAGFFQRFEYYAPHRERIHRWLQVQPMARIIDVQANDVLVNFRRGNDYDILHWTLPLSYYCETLNNLRDLGRVYVMGTGIDEHVVERLKIYDPIYFTGTVAEQFAFFGRFRRMLISNSTFAWWAAFLSDAELIYAPRSLSDSCYGFSGFRDVDLHMHEPRYQEVSTAGNPVRSRTLCAQTRLLRTELTDGRTVEACVSGLEPRSMAWLLEQPEAVGCDEFLKMHPGTVSAEALANLMKSGLLTAGA